MGNKGSQNRRVQPQDSWQRRDPNTMPSDNDKAAADRLRLEGNQAFAKGKYAAALERYTEALTLNPVPALYTNRAFAHKKRGDWPKVIEDSRSALRMDASSLKGHYYLGLGLRESGELAEAIQHLSRALELARSSGDSIKDEIWAQLASAKYRQWEEESAARTAEREVLQMRMSKALVALQQSEVAECMNGSRAELQQQHAAEKAAMERLFADAAHRDTAGNSVNSAFTCRLTLEPFREPVTTPSGLSYEKSALLNHLATVGKFDPVTRELCTERDVRLNLGLRAATQEYLDQHAWAWRDCC